ncbi:MAG TPA: AAA family ATPase [bacterium]|nr:AAA family ATPase [bacterium]
MTETLPAAPPTRRPLGSPDWPEWAQTLARKYYSATISHFVLVGNIEDLVPVKRPEGTVYLALEEFLAQELFAPRELVITYDLSAGIRPGQPKMRAELLRRIRAYDTIHGTTFAQELPKHPLQALQLMGVVVRQTAASGVAVILRYGELLFPASDTAHLAQTDRAAMIALHELVADPNVLRADATIVTVAEDLAALNDWLLRDPHTAAITVPYPDGDARRGYLAHEAAAMGAILDDAAERRVVAFSSGLTLRQTASVLKEANTVGIALDDPQHWFRRKREIIEAQVAGLLEFMVPRYTLDMVAVHDRAVEVLKRDVELVKAGRFEAVPMGYLICGPIGSGKTFLMQAFAGEAGIPCVTLKNFRSKWQGATEANLERVLTLLKSLAPVLVVIDEADAFLGDRDEEGDSGVSSRVFSTLTSFMGDTANRGRILWALLTNRPDLLAVDLKRQGRAEQHIPLFPPSTPEHYEDLFQALLKKLRLPIAVERMGEVIDLEHCTLNGSDLESVLVRAHALALVAGREAITPEDLKAAYDDFLPPVYPQKVEYQTLQGVLESTSKALIPERWRMDRQALEARLAELRPYVD